MNDHPIYEPVFSYHTHQTKTVLCPICKGDGVVEIRRHYGHTSGWIYENKVCGICDGKGRLQKTRQTTYRKL